MYRWTVRSSRALFFVLLGVVLIGFWVRFADLPPMVASHFGANGKPDGWMSRGGFAWFSLLPLFVVLIVTFVAPVMVAKLPPSRVNFPNKDYWLAPERKEEAIGRFAARMEWFGVVLLAFIAFVYELVFEANAARRGLANGPFLIALVAFLLFALVWIVSMYRAFALPPERRPR